MADWDVVELKVIDEQTLFVRFSDGVSGTLQFTQSFFRGVFSQLSDPCFFRQAMIQYGVVTWPGELDLAPDTMHDELERNGNWIIR